VDVDDLVTRYVTFRRALGERCQTTEATLRSFCRAAGPQAPVARIPPDAASAFLAGAGPVTGRWHGKYRALRGEDGHA
jgi:hypothetical protein